VSFVPEYTIPTTQREYGSIYLPNGDNVAELGVKAGWLKVREGGKTVREDQEEALEHLLQLQNEAEDAKVGMWSDEKVNSCFCDVLLLMYVFRVFVMFLSISMAMLMPF
jgi:staphylococcal nuclease domain-containing protein 1